MPQDALRRLQALLDLAGLDQLPELCQDVPVFAAHCGGGGVAGSRIGDTFALTDTGNGKFDHVDVWSVNLVWKF